MPPSLTAQRMRLAREIKTTLADAKEQLQENPSPETRIRLEDLVNALEQRLTKRRIVVLSARAASAAKWIEARRRRARTTPVWGFPLGYDPKGRDQCEICLRSDRWVSRPVPNLPTTAWLCSACCSWPPNAPAATYTAPSPSPLPQTPESPQIAPRAS